MRWAFGLFRFNRQFCSIVLFVSGCHVLQGHNGSESHHSFAFFFCCWYVSIPTTLTNVDPTFKLNKITQVLKTKSNCFCPHIPPHAAHESLCPWCAVLVFLHFTVCLWTHKAERVITTPPTNPQKSCSVAMTTEIKAIKDNLSRNGRSKFAHSRLSSARQSCDPLSTLISLCVILFNKTRVLTNEQA